MNNHNLFLRSLNGLSLSSWKLWGIFFSLKRILCCLNQWLMPKRAAKFAKRASCEIRYLELFNNNAEEPWDRQDGGISLHAEWRNILKRGMPFSTRQKALKWYCNKVQLELRKMRFVVKSHGRKPLRFQGSPMISTWMKQNVYYSRMFERVALYFFGSCGKEKYEQWPKIPTHIIC